MKTSPTASAAPAPARTRLALLLVVQCAVVLACVLPTTLIAIAVQERSIRAATEERVLDVSQSLAELEQVQSAVRGDRDEAMAQLQPLADIIQKSAGVDYVVITDAAGIRLTHPTPSERGRPVSTDPSDVLGGEVFVGTEVGTIGPTLRAKVPVVWEGDVVGTASVGILESDIAAAFDSAVRGLLPWVIGSLIAGFALSALITVSVGRRVRSLEAGVRELETQRRVADALRDQTHEFHTRLHVIRGLVAEGETPAALEYIGGITTVDAGSSGAVIDDPALRGLLEGIADDARSASRILEIDESSSVPRGVLDDRDLVVVANLCRNALEASAHRARVHVLADADHVLIDVTDDGPGVPAEDVARIFQRGVSGKAEDRSRGVGLDLVRRHVGGRAGTITVSASDDGGARFTVDMPSAAAGGPT